MGMRDMGGRYAPEGMRGNSGVRDRCALERAAEEGAILEGMCNLCDCATMQLTVDLPGGVRGIIPRGEACWQPGGGETKDIAIITRVGKQVCFKIREIYETAEGVVASLSRSAAQRECAARYLATLTPGDIIPARVTHLEPFGAFCDVGCGIIALLTVDRISVSRIAHPSDRFRVGEEILAVVSAVEESGRLYLSHRELLGTWAENAAAFAPGQTVPGVIRSVETYGVFVELAPNLAGLAELHTAAVPGARCSVYIKSILPERMKVKLVLIDVGEPAERLPVRYFVDPAVCRMDAWTYSPDGCRKRVETVFAETSCASEAIR